MTYYKAWYRSEGDRGSLDPSYPEWVVYAIDEEEAREKVLDSIGLSQPERGRQIILTSIDDEDEGTVAFATARQNGQALP